MLIKYLSIATRDFRKNFLHSIISVLSLSVGLAACIVIYLFISEERSFDSFHEKSKAIYRLNEIQSFEGTNVQKVALSMPMMGPGMASDFPEVSNYVRLWDFGTQVILNESRQIVVDRIVASDTTFFSIFSFNLLFGERDKVLSNPNSLVLTEKTALKFFSDSKTAFGNSLTLSGQEFLITGIIEDIPENSHIQFDALISLNFFIQNDPQFNKKAGSNFLFTYLLINNNADLATLQEKFPDFLIRHSGDKDINQKYRLFLQSLKDIHLTSTDIEHDYMNHSKFNGKYLTLFLIIGAFILLIASFNFVNLCIVRASSRYKEIAVRKTLGAIQSQIFFQFIFESILLTLCSFFLAIGLDILFVPIINASIGSKLDFWQYVQPLELGISFASVVGLGILTGLYPSFLASFKINSILKTNEKGSQVSVFRKGLVICQFSLAIGMIISVLIVLAQLNYVREKDLGLNTQNILLVKINEEANVKLNILKDEILSHPEILGVTASGQRLGNNIHQGGFRVKTESGFKNVTPSNLNVDPDFLEVYGIELKEGRNFTKSNSSADGKAFIINESFKKSLDLKEAIGTPAGFGSNAHDSLGTIIGVAKDFHFNSLHFKINTLTLVVDPKRQYVEMSVKFRSGETKSAINIVKDVWEKHISSYPFTYSILDDHFENLYKSDNQMSAVVIIMAILTLLISCLGLFAITAITFEKRTKEIGIRKILGATPQQISLLFVKKLIVLVIISWILITPLAFWIISVWLQNFSYKINIPFLPFLVGGVSALCIALLTTSYHTIKVVKENPIKALRYE